MIKLHWVRDTTGNYLKFQTFNIASANGEGVYVIWHSGQPSRVVKVGQGVIPDRLGSHRRDTTITGYNQFGLLLVTWAIVPVAQRDGVERYLGDYWKPQVADRFPDCLPIVVNSPF